MYLQPASRIRMKDCRTRLRANATPEGEDERRSSRCSQTPAGGAPGQARIKATPVPRRRGKERSTRTSPMRPSGSSKVERRGRDPAARRRGLLKLWAVSPAVLVPYASTRTSIDHAEKAPLAVAQKFRLLGYAPQVRQC